MLQRKDLLSSSLQERSPQLESHSSQFFLAIAGVEWFAIENLSDFSSLLPSPERTLYWVAVIGLGYGVYYLSSVLSTLPDGEDDDIQTDATPNDRLSEEDDRKNDQNDDNND